MPGCAFPEPRAWRLHAVLHARVHVVPDVRVIVEQRGRVARAVSRHRGLGHPRGTERDRAPPPLPARRHRLMVLFTPGDIGPIAFLVNDVAVADQPSTPPPPSTSSPLSVMTAIGAARQSSAMQTNGRSYSILDRACQATDNICSASGYSDDVSLVFRLIGAVWSEVIGPAVPMDWVRPSPGGGWRVGSLCLGAGGACQSSLRLA